MCGLLQLSPINITVAFTHSPKAIEFFGFHPESQKENLKNPVNPVNDRR
jgi:hypothetical protein